MLKLRMVSPLLAAFVMVFAAGCEESDDDADAATRPPVQPFDIVTPAPSAGKDEAPIAVADARVLADGSTQILVEGGACLVLNRAEVKESGDAVSVSAFAVDTTGSGACTAQIVPWFVPVKLDAPIGNRELRDGDSGEGVRVIDCALTPSEPLCGY